METAAHYFFVFNNLQKKKCLPPRLDMRHNLEDYSATNNSNLKHPALQK